MEYIVRKDCDGVDWIAVAATLKRVGMGNYDPLLHRKAFEASYAVVFLYDGEVLVGFGRAIADGAYQAAVYDCAVLPEYQGQHLGRLIMDTLMERLAGMHVILYAAPGKEGFYKKHGFLTMKTGMAKFINAEDMARKGFTESGNDS